jgi:hypothetical protein
MLIRGDRGGCIGDCEFLVEDLGLRAGKAGEASLARPVGLCDLGDAAMDRLRDACGECRGPRTPFSSGSTNLG